tara:strand:+ start:4629 stop:5318 length:690 start_codon:yes stop_codon:yes gene_type:complete
MKAYAIVIKDHKISETGYKNLCQSSEIVKNNFKITKFNAIVPERNKALMERHNIKWNYPWSGSVSDFSTGLTKSAYKTANPEARIACALSHWTLWSKAAADNDTILILEHDACFTAKLDITISKKFNILGINNPLGCTRLSKVYYDKILENSQDQQLVPWIDSQHVPQGLAGNSSYIITPDGAKQMLKLVKDFGLWPNDALMCRQLLKGLGVSRKFYTTTQKLRSTTTQ